MKFPHIKDNKAKEAIVGAAAGLVSASLKTRQFSSALDMEHGGPSRLSRGDWWRALNETRKALGSKHLSTLAAGVAYYSVLAFFPFLAAGVALAALLITPHQLGELIRIAETYLPADLAKIVGSELQSLIGHRADNLLAAGIAIVVALFTASGASKNLVVATNVAYDVKESRGWLTQQAWGVVWTAIGVLFGIIFVIFLSINRGILNHFGVPPLFTNLFLYGRWLLILLFAIAGLAIFYRYGPDRPLVKWQWVNWGAVLATLIWIFATVLFFFYVQRFANYAQSYSVLAGIIILMIWINLSVVIILLGAEFNHRLEEAGRTRQTRWGERP